MWWLILTSDWLLEPAIYKMSNLKSMSVYVSLIILTAVATERAFVSMMLLLRLCLDFTLHLTPSSLQWFWLPLRDLSSSENCRSLTWGSSQEYPWQCSCPGRLPLAGGLHHNSYSRALTAVDVVVTGCRCGPPVPGHCPVSSGQSGSDTDTGHISLLPVIPMHYWWPVMLMSGVNMLGWSLLMTMVNGDYEASVKVTRAQSANTGPSSAL